MIHPDQSLTHPFIRSRAEVSAFVDSIKNIYMVTKPAILERRKDLRYSIPMKVTLSPLDQQLQPADGEYSAISKDISVSGLGVIVTRPFDHQFVLATIESGGQPVFNIVAKVVYSRQFGGYYQAGLQFLGGEQETE